MVRKTVTLVFCDVADSTPLGERLDPESLRAVWSSYHETAREVLERHGGTIEKFVGDAVMAAFGIPVVHEDDALRAVRAAVELREALAALNDRLDAAYGVRIEVRTGVNTGEVIAGDPEQGQAFATGDAVNVAQRLEAAAAGGEILVGDTTIRLVRDAVVADPMEPLALKGKSEPVAVWRLPRRASRRRRCDAAGRHAAGRPGRRACAPPLCSRPGRAASGPAASSPSSATPGVGKSRLAAELVTSLGEDAQSSRAAACPTGTGSPTGRSSRSSAGSTSTRSCSGEPDGQTVHGRLLEAVGRAEPHSSQR